MKTVQITESFTGYPNGTDEKLFTKGEAPTLANEFADLIIGKGLAKEIAEPAPAPAAKGPVKAAIKDIDA